jgi:acyl-CoA synthetase (AMP-forming)/AMP-acid ligase II
MRNFTTTLKDHYESHPDRISWWCNWPKRRPADNLPRFTARFCRMGGPLPGTHIQPGEVVILIMQHSVELIYAYFGAVCMARFRPFFPT